MQGCFHIAVFLSVYLAADVCRAQDLAPRAYLITPVHSNAVTLTYSFFDGNLLFEGTAPITGATARAHVAIFNYSRSLNFFLAVQQTSLPHCRMGLGTSEESLLTRKHLRTGRASCRPLSDSR